MQMTVENRDVRVSAGLEKSSDFGIHRKSGGMIASMLSERLYSDKIMAFVREYMCNAIDIHKKHNISRKVFVTLPTAFSPICSIRDFGSGLSRRCIKYRYVMFGYSDKRNSDDYIGSFGLGCKAGFSYSESFVITSWFDGFRTCYTAQKMDTGKFSLILVSREPSDEPSGIEISIAVKSGDVQAFRQKIAQFCKYLTEKPDFNEADFAVPEISYSVKSEKFFIEEGYGSYGNNCRVLMGNVAYPVDTNLINEKYRNFRSVCILAKIGDVSVTPDREKLDYNEKTKDFLNNSFAEIVEVAEKEAQANMDKKSNPWDAIQCLNDTVSAFRLNLDISLFTYKGKKFESTKNHVYYYYQGRRGRVQSDTSTLSPVYVGQNELVINVDPSTDIKPKRIFEGFRQRGEYVPNKIIVTTDKEAMDTLFCEYRKVVTDFKSLWNVREKSANKTPREVYIYRNSSSRGRTPLSKAETKVFIDRNDKEFSNYSQAAHICGITFYGVSEAVAKKLPAEWVSLKDSVSKCLDTLLKNSESIVRNKVKEALESKAKRTFHVLETILPYCTDGEKKIIKEAISFKYENQNKNGTLEKLGSLIGVDVSSKIGNMSAKDSEMVDKTAQILAKYSEVIKFLDNSYFTDEHASVFIGEYIKLLNKVA